MRREGFELTVGKPEVVTKVIDGKLHEPFEHLSVDVPTESLGAVTQLLAGAQGRAEPDGARREPGPHGVPRAQPRPHRLPHRVPDDHARRGHRQPRLRRLRPVGRRDQQPAARLARSPTAPAPSPAYAVDALSDRGELFVGPGTLVYGGMVIGEYTRNEDLEVNIVREKKLTNMRKSTGDELIKLTPPTLLTLEQSLEFCANDECVEVTPENVRIRKAELDSHLRAARPRRGPARPLRAARTERNPRRPTPVPRGCGWVRPRNGRFGRVTVGGACGTASGAGRRRCSPCCSRPAPPPRRPPPPRPRRPRRPRAPAQPGRRRRRRPRRRVQPAPARPPVAGDDGAGRPRAALGVPARRERRRCSSTGRSPPAPRSPPRTRSPSPTS